MKTQLKAPSFLVLYIFVESHHVFSNIIKVFFEGAPLVNG